MNNLILLMKIVSFITVSFYILLVWLPTFIVLKPTYKYYKVTYDAIKSKEYILSSSGRDFISFRPMVTPNNQTLKNFYHPHIYDDEILYFKDTGGIKLIKGYIHKREGMLWMDPYTNYWYNKIKTQIMINSSVENMREYKLRQLKIK